MISISRQKDVTIESSGQSTNAHYARYENRNYSEGTTCDYCDEKMWKNFDHDTARRNITMIMEQRKIKILLEIKIFKNFHPDKDK